MKISQILLILCILGSASIAYFLTYPTYLDRTLKEDELNTVAEEVSNLKKSGDFLKNLANQPILAQKAAQAKELIPTEEQQELYIGEIDRLTKEHGLTLSTITFSQSSARKAAATKPAEEGAGATGGATDTATKKSLKEIKFTATIIGDFTASRKFIEALKTRSRYTTISSVSMATNDLGLITTIDGLIYTKPEPGKPPLDGNISTASWSYLDRINKTTTANVDTSPAGRTDPFQTYASPSPSPAETPSPSPTPSP